MKRSTTSARPVRPIDQPLSRGTAQTSTFDLRSLRSLPFTAFARCVADLLTGIGYGEVRLAGRTGYKGRNRDGGYDLTATMGKGTSRRRVIVQLKQFKLLTSDG